MELASFQNFIKTILILVLLYYLFKFAFRLFAPILITKVVKKAEQNFHDKQRKYQENYQSENNQQQKEDINNQFSKNKFPREKKKVGEYIDFEEVN